MTQGLTMTVPTSEAKISSPGQESSPQIQNGHGHDDVEHVGSPPKPLELPCSTCRQIGPEVETAKRECSNLRIQLANSRQEKELQNRTWDRKLLGMKNVHQKALKSVHSTVLEQQGQGDDLKKDLETLTQQRETLVKGLVQENQRLREEIAQVLIRIDEKSAEADEEGLKVAKLLNQMKDAKRGIKKIHGDDDESYIEIIIP